MMAKWEMKIDGETIFTKIIEPNGNPEETSLRITFDSTDEIPFLVEMSEVEYEDGEPAKVLNAVSLSLTDEEFTQMLSHLNQLHSVSHML